MAEHEKTAWTPGPWLAQNDGTPRYAVRHFRKNSRHPVRICTVINTHPAGDEREESDANAHLISAAPDLAEALQAFTDKYVEMINSGDCGFWNPEEETHVIDARAALAKARGESA